MHNNLIQEIKRNEKNFLLIFHLMIKIQYNHIIIFDEYKIEHNYSIVLKLMLKYIHIYLNNIHYFHYCLLIL